MSPLHSDVRRRLARTRARIHDELGEELRIADLSREACYSDQHFVRMFKRIYGVTPGRYVSDLRIARAKDLLARGMSVTEACFAVGFSSLGSFSTLFSARTGCSPRAFQRQMRVLGAVPARLCALYVPWCFVGGTDSSQKVHFEEATPPSAALGLGLTPCSSGDPP